MKVNLQGIYKVYLEVKHGSQAAVLFRGFIKAKIHDYWIVAIGDSFASGEGNPDKSLVDDESVQWVSGEYLLL